MRNRFLNRVAFAIMVIILFSIFTGCTFKNSNTTSNTETKKVTFKDGKNETVVLASYKIRLVLPDKWEKEVSGTEVFFTDGEKVPRGGVLIVGYYPGQPMTASLPNHSTQESIEDMDTPLGRGKLVMLKRDNPAATGNSNQWQELHVLIPTQDKNEAFDFWLIVKDSAENTKAILAKVLEQAR